MQAAEALRGYDGDVAVLMGDAVFLEPETLRKVLAEHSSAGARATVVTGVLEDPTGLGRIVRDADGRVKAIVEERDASAAEKAIREVNSGCYVFDYGRLRRALEKLRPDNRQKEYYVTDVVRLFVEEGDTVLCVAAEDAREVLGINTRGELALAARLLRERTLERLMLSGVTVVDPATTHVDPRARVSPDTVIEPFSILEGALVVEAGCHLGPYCHLVGRRSLDPPAGEPAGLPAVAAGTRLGRGCHVLTEPSGAAGPTAAAPKGA